MTAVMTGGEFGAPRSSSDGSPSQTSCATGATGSPISPFSSASSPRPSPLTSATVPVGGVRMGYVTPTVESPWSSPRRTRRGRCA